MGAQSPNWTARADPDQGGWWTRWWYGLYDYGRASQQAPGAIRTLEDASLRGVECATRWWCGQAKGHLAAVQDGVMHVVEVVCISAGRSPSPSTPTGSSSHAPEARCAPWSNQLSPRPVHHPTTLHNTTRPPESAASWLISMPFEKCTITILTKTAHLFGQRGPPVTLHLDCPANHLHLDFPPIIGPSAASSTVPIGAPIVV